ncbi:MAG: hypothetical protein IKU72_02055 [Oscillospiraceae bacterium]|nr:hypothetical protein [Oscillospiraceae bacterium]
MTINGRGYCGGAQSRLNLTVVSGLTQPENPANNTIWLNSDLAVNGVYIGPTCEVMNPQVGAVWINNSTRYHPDTALEISSVTCTMVVSQQPFLLINILQVSQWDGEEWVHCDGAVFSNYEWTDMALYIFYHGTMNVDFPVGVGYASSASAAVENNHSPTHNSEYMVVEGDGEAIYCTVTTKQGCGVDAGRFATLGIGYSKQGGTLTSSRLYCGFTTNLDSPLSFAEADNAQSVQLTSSAELQEVTVPIECAGLVRPTVKFQSSSSDPYSLAIHYWVLT